MLSIYPDKIANLVCMIDHAHPTYVVGHPFKGSASMSSGQLAHPDLKRFQIVTPYLFQPPNPEKVAGASSAAP